MKSPVEPKPFPWLYVYITAPIAAGLIVVIIVLIILYFQRKKKEKKYQKVYKTRLENLESRYARECKEGMAYICFTEMQQCLQITFTVINIGSCHEKSLENLHKISNSLSPSLLLEPSSEKMIKNESC